MSDHKLEFPLPNMPRMGRRNAITPTDKDVEVDNDDGAFSPANLLERASLTPEGKGALAGKGTSEAKGNLIEGYTYTSLDPEGAIKKELDQKRPTKENDNKGKTFKKVTPPSSPTHGTAEGWNRIADAVTKVEAMLDPRESARFKQRLGIPIDTPQAEEQQQQQEQVHKPGTGQVIPWKKHDPNLHTITEERRKIFESFNKTSMEPPETPKASESKIKRMMSRRFRKKKQQSDSEESLLDLPVTPTKPKSRNPYANVPAKVNTRWNKYEEVIDSKEQLEKEHLKIARKAANIIGKAVGASMSSKPSKRASKTISQTKTTVVKKPGPTIKIKATAKKEGAVTALKAKPLKGGTGSDTKPGSSPRLTPNYPPGETFRSNVPKLPLTIGPPRHSPRRAMGMVANSVQNRADLIGETTTRLYGSLSPYQKLKFDANHMPQTQTPVPAGIHGAGGTSYRSTFFNLHRINNGGITNNTKQALNNSVAQLIVVRRPEPGSFNGVISVEKKKAGPPVTTIQAPPSPFMTSNISIPSQLNEIPVNGEVKLPPVVEKVSTATPVTKPARKPVPKRESVVTNRAFGMSNFVRNVPPRLFTRNNIKIGKTVGAKTPSAAAPKAKPAAQKAAARHQNKYNNIYIGPYSGSESEGETQAHKKKN